MTEDRGLPPDSIHAEMCLLGSMLLTGRATLAAVFSSVRGNDFYHIDHQLIFDAIASLYQRGHPVDAMAVRELLIQRGILGDIGGTECLACILNAVPNDGDSLSLARTVLDLADQRRSSN